MYAKNGVGLSLANCGAKALLYKIAPHPSVTKNKIFNIFRNMYSPIVKRSVQRASTRAFSQTRAALSKDAFSEKEQAQENVYMRQKETEQLKALKEKIAHQEKTIEDLKAQVNKK